MRGIPFHFALVASVLWVFGFAPPVTAVESIFIPNLKSNSVSVIDAAASTVASTIGVGVEPYGVGASPDGKTVYVTNLLGDTVSVIDTPSGGVKTSIKVGDFPFGVTVCPDGRFAYVANGGDGAVSVIDTTTRKMTASIAVGIDPHGVACSADSSRLYVTNYSSGTVSVVNTATRKVFKNVTVGGGPHGIVVSRNGSLVYVANVFDGTVSVIWTATNTVTATIQVGLLPFVPALSPGGRFLYVTSHGTNSVIVVDTTSNSVVGSIPVGAAPHGIGFGADGLHAYVANEAGNTVSVIDTRTNTVVKTIPVGTQPIAFGEFVVDVPRFGVSMGVPAGAKTFAYEVVEDAVADGSPGGAKPVSVGSVADGGPTLSLGVGAYAFRGPVDAYLGLLAPGIGGSEILLFTPAGIQAMSLGIVPWKAGVTDITGAVLPDLPVSLLPSGDYTFLLLVVPQGTPPARLTENYYLWTTTYTILRASEVAERAIALLGGDIPAVVAILFALDKGYSIEDISDAILLGSLTPSGDLPGLQPRRGESALAKGRFNDRFCDHPEDDAKCRAELEEFLGRLAEGNPNGTTYLSGILLAGQRGYTATQITEGLVTLYQGASFGVDVEVGDVLLSPTGLIEKCLRTTKPGTGRILCDEWDWVQPIGARQEVFTCEDAQGPDTDGDGVRDICDSDDDSDGVADVEDCAPTDVGRFPGNFEFCGDGIDQDCNGEDLPCEGCFPDTGCCGDYPYICGPDCISGGEDCCRSSGGFCPAGSDCCAGGCMPDGMVCCPVGGFCQPGETCCGTNTCVPPGGECCGDGACAPGWTCCPSGCCKAAAPGSKTKEGEPVTMPRIRSTMGPVN